MLAKAAYGLGHVDVPPDFDAVANYRHVTKWAAQLNRPSSRSDRRASDAGSALHLPAGTEDRAWHA